MEINCSTERNCDQDSSLEIIENEGESNITKDEISENSIKLNKVKKPNRRASEKFNEIKQKLREISVEDLQKLCEQISSLNDRILNAREMTYLRYELPEEMKDKLEMEAQELESLYVEMKAATRNLEIIRVQRAALGKEKHWMETQISKLKADVVTEMEIIVSVYDSEMIERWENIKQSNSIQEVENFMHDVKGKLEAMKNLQILGANKLADLKNQDKRKEEVLTKKEKKRINREERGCGGGGGRHTRSGSTSTNPSQTILPLFFDAESDEFLLDDSTVFNNVMYSLVCDQGLSLNFPSWTHGLLDID